MNGNEATTTDFEFDCPQFTDFSAITAKEDNDISEEFCQNYFDKKGEEIKRNSSEFNKENIEIDAQDHDNEDDEDDNTTIPNLLSATDFANTSSISVKSSSSYKSYSNKSSHMNLSYNKLTTKNRNNNTLTSEQIQLNAIEKKKIELEKIKQKNAKHVAKMREDHLVFHPIRSTKLTIPITPALHTTKRAKKRLKHRENNTNNYNKPLNKHRCNNSNNNNNNNSTNKRTIPQSFKLSKTNKKWKTSSTLSTEQKQLKEIQKHGNFQARKINPKIFKSNAANLGILNNINNKMSTTTFQPFNLMTEQRAQKYKINEKS